MSQLQYLEAWTDREGPAVTIRSVLREKQVPEFAHQNVPSETQFRDERDGMMNGFHYVRAAFSDHTYHHEASIAAYVLAVVNISNSCMDALSLSDAP